MIRQLLAFCLCCWLASSCGFAQSDLQINDNPDAVVITGRTMGPIPFRVVLPKGLPQSDGDPLRNAEATTKLARAIDAELEKVNQLMSTYLEDSDVSRFNRHDSDEWFGVSKETARVVARAVEISELTGGAFDITVGPLVNLWHFGPPHKERQEEGGRRIPRDAEIAEALNQIGFEKLRVRLDPPALKKLQPALQIDLSAIAKGYAVDQVASLLKERGLEDHLVEVGGEVAVSGTKRNGRSWVVGIMQPNPAVNAIYRKVPLKDRALATSGNYQNFITIGDKTYSHTIDPETGRPVEHALASCSIIARDCMTADAIATAVMVMGPERGADFCRQHDYPFFIVTRRGDQLVDVHSTDFPLRNEGSSAGTSFVTMFIGALIVFLIAVLAMAVGVMFGRKRIQGSCGGIASMESGAISPECSMCSRPTEQCSDLKKAMERREKELSQ